MQQQHNIESTHLKCLNPTSPNDVNKAVLDKKVESSIHSTKVAPISVNNKTDENESQVSTYKRIKRLSAGSRLSRYYCIGSEIRISAEPVKKESSRPILRDVIERKTGKYKILKIISKSRIPPGPNSMQAWITLCEKLLNLDRHPNLMPIYEIYESESSFYIIAEKMEGGELFDFLLKEKAIPEDICKYIIRQVLLATEYLHSRNLLHRDIKPENLMFRRNINSSMVPIEERYELALIDFDTCKMTDLPPSQQSEIVNGRRRLVGTYGYLAPEVLKGYDYSPASDLWSIGVVLYILMTGVPPASMDIMYDAQSSLNVLRHAEINGLDFDMPPFLDFPLARDLCKRFLTFDPKKRYNSATLALEHPWLTNIPACFKRVNNSQFNDTNHENNMNNHQNHHQNNNNNSNQQEHQHTNGIYKWFKKGAHNGKDRGQNDNGSGDEHPDGSTESPHDDLPTTKSPNHESNINGTRLTPRTHLTHNESTETTISEMVQPKGMICPTLNFPPTGIEMKKYIPTKTNKLSQTKLMQNKRSSSEMEKSDISSYISPAHPKRADATVQQTDTVVVEQEIEFNSKLNKLLGINDNDLNYYKQFDSLDTAESLDPYQVTNNITAMFQPLKTRKGRNCMNNKSKRFRKSNNQHTTCSPQSVAS